MFSGETVPVPIELFRLVYRNDPRVTNWYAKYIKEQKASELELKTTPAETHVSAENYLDVDNMSRDELIKAGTEAGIKRAQRVSTDDLRNLLKHPDQIEQD